jgi:DNA-binding SARP family transcriptional activator
VPEGVPQVDGATAPRIVLLDGFTMDLDGRGPSAEVDHLPRAVQRLVALLSLSGQPTRTAVAGQLWPDVVEEHSHGSLRSALWRLQKAARGLIETPGDALRLAAGVRVDVHELDDWSRRVMNPETGLDELDLPPARLQGELLPGWYDDWVLLERERLRQQRMHALEVVAARLARARRFGQALQAALAAVRAEPLRESAHRTVVRVHLAEGNVAEAVRAYDAFRILIDDELGIHPTAQMTRLVDGLGRGGPAPT